MCIRDRPNVIRYRIDLGHAYLEKYRSNLSFYVHHELIEKARREFKKAKQIKPHEIEPYLGVAATYLEEENYDRAIEWCEKAVNADEKTDFMDFEALFFMCIIHVREGKPHKITNVAKRIEELASDDPDIRNYIAGRFFSVTGQLLQIKYYEPAKHFIKAAIRFESSNDYDRKEEIRKFAEFVELVADSQSEFNKLQHDNRVIPPFKGLAAALIMIYSGEKEHTELESFFREIDYALRTYSVESFKSSLECITQNYKNIYKVNKEVWNGLLNEIKGRSSSQYQPSYSSSSGSSSTPDAGCGCVLMIVAIMCLSIPVVGWIVGIALGSMAWNMMTGKH